MPGVAMSCFWTHCAHNTTAKVHIWLLPTKVFSLPWPWRGSAAKNNTTQHSTARHGTKQCCTHYSTAQHSTAQHSTAQHSGHNGAATVTGLSKQNVPQSFVRMSHSAYFTNTVAVRGVSL